MPATSPLTETLPPDLQITADDDFTEARWAQAMTYIVGRFKALEAFTPTWQDALNGLQLIGLAQINSALLPIYTELQSIAYLGVIFKARSYSTVTMSVGTKQLFIIPADRAQFAPGVYLAIANGSSPSIAMYGSFVSYDDETGSLIVAIDTVPPAHLNEVHSDWIVFPAPQDTSAYATLTVSPALTGVPTAPTATAGVATTQIATTAFVQNALNLILDTPPSSLNTFNKIALALGNDPNFATTMASALAAKAAIANPIFTGTPQAPTAVGGSNTTQIATTAFVQNAISAQLAGATFAPITSPTFLGIPAAPTAAANTNTTQLATTAFVTTAVANAVSALKGSAPTNLDTLQEIATALGNDSSFATNTTNALALKAPLASPALTGTPTAPTASPGNNSTRIATTAYVDYAVSLVTAASGSVPSGGLAGQVLYNLGGTWQWQGLAIADISGLQAALDAKLASATAATTYAPLASPTFTGNVNAPTMVAGTNDTRVATTAFVLGEVAAVVGGAPTALNTLNKIASSLGGDAGFSGTMSAALATKAGFASPAFTGTPTAPTAAPGTNTTQLATTAFVQAAVSSVSLNNAALTGVPTAPTAAPGTNTTQIATTAFVRAITDTLAPLASPVLTGAPTCPTPVNPGTPTGVLTLVNIEFVRAITDLLSPIASPTFTGVPSAPTAAGGTSTTQIATTAFVSSALTAYALLASPALTGTPTAPTAANGTNTTQIATTAYVQTALGAYLRFDAAQSLTGGQKAQAQANLGLSNLLYSNATATLTAGFTLVPNNLGTKSSGSWTVDPTLGNTQFMTNGGAHTIAAPANDCRVEIDVTNNASAGAIAFSGFTGTILGDTYVTTNGAVFTLIVRRTNGVTRGYWIRWS